MHAGLPLSLFKRDVSTYVQTLVATILHHLACALQQRLLIAVLVNAPVEGRTLEI